MKTYSCRDKISLGRGEGVEILKTIKSSNKSVKIVSPYLSPSYLEELVKLREKGVEITLITSDNLAEENNRFSTFEDSNVIKQKKIPIPEAKTKKKNLKIASITFFLLFLLTLSLSPLLFPLFFLSIPLFFISLIIFFYRYFIKQYNYKYYSLFRLKVFDSKSGEKPRSTSLIHSKIFIIDEKICFLGSANFTYSGFKIHYETIIRVEDPKAIKDISEEVESLFNSTELKSRDIDEWGKEIYE